MKRIILLTFSLLGYLAAFAQPSGIGAEIDELTSKWDLESEKLATYEGLSSFCMSPEYRGEMISTLKGIHHLDSVLYQTLVKKVRFGGDKEMKKTLADIEKMEKEYSMNEFLGFLYEECQARNEIEKEARKTGEDKDSEMYLLETELSRFVKHITKRIDLIREHVHHLNIR